MRVLSKETAIFLEWILCQQRTCSWAMGTVVLLWQTVLGAMFGRFGGPASCCRRPGTPPPGPASPPRDWEAPAQRSARQCRARSHPLRSGDSQLPGTSCTKKTTCSSFPTLPINQNSGCWRRASSGREERTAAWGVAERPEGRSSVPRPRSGWWSRPCPARGPRQPWAIL